VTVVVVADVGVGVSVGVDSDDFGVVDKTELCDDGLDSGVDLATVGGRGGDGGSFVVGTGDGAQLEITG
jgi:hypothetical protein